MARASTHTLLSLDRYAKIMGITPPHFGQGVSSEHFWGGATPQSKCNDVWFQYDWQSHKSVSRESLAYAIRDAEDDIAEIIGYHPAPRWQSKEMHTYPRLYRRELYGNGRDNRLQMKGLKADWGKFIAAGRRNVTLVGDSVAPVYSDPNGQGFNDTATITVAGITTTDECELKVYFEDHNGEQVWEIRPHRTKTLVAGTLTVTFDSWLFIDPDLWEEYPGASGSALDGIDYTLAANLVTNVDVYREFTDFTQASAEFSWEPKPLNFLVSDFLCTSCSGTGCAACENTIQEGCLHVRDVENGILVPQPATFSAADDQWNKIQWLECREPDTVKFWYYAGELDQRFLRGTNCDGLSPQLAQSIAWLATARLEKDVCGCQNTVDLVKHLRVDMALTDPNGVSFFINDDILNNPFGTRVGEVRAWKHISRMTEIIPAVGVIA